MSSRLQRFVTSVTRRLAPRVPDFHGLLQAQADAATRALDELLAFIETGEESHSRRVREIEKEGDRLEAHTLETLARSFAAPMDRGSIHLAATAIDDVINYAKTTVREMEALGATPDRWMGDLAAALSDGGAHLARGFATLRDDPEAARVEALAVHKAERNAEKLFRAALAEAFAPEPHLAALDDGENGDLGPAIERLLLTMKRREIYRHLSNTADRLDDAGRALLEIVLTEV